MGVIQGSPMLMGGDFNVTLEANDRPKKYQRAGSLFSRFLDVFIGTGVTRDGTGGLLVHMEEHEWQYHAISAR